MFFFPTFALLALYFALIRTHQAGKLWIPNF